jgi:two-component system, cell cycle sensor histidine kinase and response regulator CckA
MPSPDDLPRTQIEGHVRTEPDRTKIEEPYWTLFEASPNPILLLDREILVITGNRASADMLGHADAAEIMGKHFPEFVRPIEQPRLERELQRALLGESLARAEYRVTRRDGTEIPMEISAALTGSSAAGHLGLVVFLQDRREHWQLQAQLTEAQRMEAVGLLAGGIGHDFKNLLTIVFCATDNLLLDMARDDPGRSEVEAIRRAGKQAASLASELLSLTRRHEHRPEMLDLNKVVGEMTSVLGRLLTERIELRIRCDWTLWPVKADATQMQQAVMNLVVNARDAMPLGGQVVIETANRTLDALEAALVPDGRPGDYAVLSVYDNGTGMDRETRQRIFEPFFTTKTPGSGTGLGLATVGSIVRLCDGFIRVSSAPGEGTSFELYFPRVP